MSLLTPKTQLESDLAEKDDSVIRCAEAAHHFACVLSNENARFWAIPTERLLAVLNNDVAITLATFQANTTAGMAVNAILDALNDSRFPTRAPIDTGRADIVFNGTEFALVPPEEPPAE
jgi:hypothetical protein